ncbi:VOC family protein [Phytoactinopolyspora mesophila]|uniref:VOC family protein n=1 Tax=Phytoactinopolyspora mesophila TaxID=2650750 RepID=A0A7K3LXA9_9ACTN|nr:VOC family protein [Phytoactinopolyspora mesophila]
MQSTLVAVTYGAQNPTRVAQFWAGLLGRELVEDGDGVLLPGADGQLGLRFVADGVPPAGQHRIHLHLTSTSLADQQHTVAIAVELGASHLDVGQRRDEGHIVLSDPEGYEFCVIEPGNRFLADCGRLGEFTCDGTRAVGAFWSKALRWPLVWDKGAQTAVQSPQGGTKVSWDAWHRAPDDLGPQRSGRQRFELVATGGDLEAEVDRLVGLGAQSLRSNDRGVIVLADPDGREFRLRAP